MIDGLFSLPVYKGEVENPSEIDRLVFENYDYSKYKVSPEEWLCDVDATWKSKMFGWEEEFAKIISVHLERYLGFLNTKESVYLDQPWINFYKKGQWQEQHAHCGSYISYTYCVEEGDASFFFHSPYKTVAMLSNGIAKEKMEYVLKKGDILIFPSFLDHSVTANKSDKERITIAGNVEFHTEEINES